MELILFEPRLRSSGSHYLNYVLDICQAAQKRGLKTKVFADCAIEADARQEIKNSRIDLFPVFLSTLIDRIKVRAIIWPLMALIYSWILVKHTKNITGDHIICTVSGTLEYLSGISVACLTGQFKRNIVVQMYSWETREHSTATPRLIRLYRRVTEKVVTKAIDMGYLSLRGQGSDVANHIANRLNRSVLSLPFAIEWSNFKSNNSKNNPLQIGFMGVMRAEKGFRQFVEAVENLPADVEIVIQVQMPNSLGEADAYKLLERLNKNHRCRILEGELKVHDYRTILSRLDIAVLPYSPKEFLRKTSNIFSESMGLGKVIVTPRATLMGQMLADMKLGVTYSPYTGKALQDGILAAISDFDTLHQKAQIAANTWREENSADSFIHHILN